MSTHAERSAAAKKGARTRARNAKKHANPTSSCAPVRPRSSKSRGFNVHVNDVFMYRGEKLKVIGCGSGSVAHKSTGAATGGTYACLNERTNKVRYLAKRVVRDLVYNKGTVGRPAPKGPRTAKARKRARAKMTPAEKAAWKRKMDRAKAAKARR